MKKWYVLCVHEDLLNYTFDVINNEIGAYEYYNYLVPKSAACFLINDDCIILSAMKKRYSIDFKDNNNLKKITDLCWNDAKKKLLDLIEDDEVTNIHLTSENGNYKIVANKEVK